MANFAGRFRAAAQATILLIVIISVVVVLLVVFEETDPLGIEADADPLLTWDPVVTLLYMSQSWTRAMNGALVNSTLFSYTSIAAGVSSHISGPAAALTHNLGAWSMGTTLAPRGSGHPFVLDNTMLFFTPGTLGTDAISNVTYVTDSSGYAIDVMNSGLG